VDIRLFRIGKSFIIFKIKKAHFANIHTGGKFPQPTLPSVSAAYHQRFRAVLDYSPAVSFVLRFVALLFPAKAKPAIFAVLIQSHIFDDNGKSSASALEQAADFRHPLLTHRDSRVPQPHTGAGTSP
jgi:hypothetical protein